MHIVGWKMHNIINREPDQDYQGNGLSRSELFAIHMHDGHDADDYNSDAENGDDALNPVTGGIKKNQEGEKDGDHNTLNGIFYVRVLSNDLRPSSWSLSEVFHLIWRWALLNNHPFLPFIILDFFFFSRDPIADYGFRTDCGEDDIVVFEAEELIL